MSFFLKQPGLVDWLTGMGWLTRKEGTCDASGTTFDDALELVMTGGDRANVTL